MKCKECEFCKCRGRSQSQCYEPGRKHYYCTYAKVKECGNRALGFIGFGTNTYESLLTTKTSPRGCPLIIKKVVHHTILKCIFIYCFSNEKELFI